MMIERQVSIFFTGVGAAIVVPQYEMLAHHAPAGPGAALAVGGVLGALGIFLGTLGAMESEPPVLRVIGIGFWVCAALAFDAALAAGAMHSPGWGHRILFGAVGALPVAGTAVALLRGSA